MDRLTVTIKDHSKLSTIISFLSLFDFVEIEKEKKISQKSNYDLFASAGIWSKRNIEANELRDKSWRLQK